MNTEFPEFPENFLPTNYQRDIELFTEQMKEMADSMTHLSKSSVHVVRAFQTMYTALNYKREFGVISESEYFDELAKIRDRYFSRSSQEWYKYTLEIYNGKIEMLSKYKESVLTHLEEMSEVYAEELAGLTEAREKFQENLESAFGSKTGFDTVKNTIYGYFDNDEPWVFYEYNLSDFDKEIEELKEFDETLKALKERGETLSPDIFRTFFEELRTLSVEDANILAKLLLESEDEEFLHYLEGYKTKKDLTKSISVNLYEDDFQNLMREVEEALENAYAQIPPEFFEIGEMTAENFKEGFLAEIKSIFWEIESLLEENTFNFAPTFGPKEAANNFAPTYNFYGETGTVYEQLISAKNQAVLDKLRLQSEI